MMNVVIMTGRLATTPECKTTANGKVLCYFRIGVDRSRRQNGKKEADFFNVIAWNVTGETIAKWFDKGDTISIIGRMENDMYEKDGVKHYDNRIVVKEFYFHSDYRKKETKPEPSVEDLEAFNAILNDPNVSF